MRRYDFFYIITRFFMNGWAWGRLDSKIWNQMLNLTYWVWDSRVELKISCLKSKSKVLLTLSSAFARQLWAIARVQKEPLAHPLLLTAVAMNALYKFRQAQNQKRTLIHQVLHMLLQVRSFPLLKTIFFVKRRKSYLMLTLCSSNIAVYSSASNSNVPITCFKNNYLQNSNC